MDSNPTFGGQELLETLSQASTGNGSSTHHSSGELLLSKQSLSSTTSSSKNNNNNNDKTASSTNGNNSLARALLPPSLSGALAGASTARVDEAYRRLGRRLSMQAHGDEPFLSTAVASPQKTRISPSPNTSFVSYKVLLQQQQQQQQEIDNITTTATTTAAVASNHGNYSNTTTTLPDTHRMSPTANDQTENRYRTSKVAKMRYSDHGEHHPRRTSSTTSTIHSNILRKLTFEGQESFLQWEEDEREKQQRLSTTHSRGGDDSVYSDVQVSPQRYAFSQLALQEGTTHQHRHPHQQQHRHQSYQHQHHHHHHNHATSSNASSCSMEEDIPESGPPPPSSTNYYTHHRGIRMGPAGTAASNSKGLLSAVLEGHSESTASHPPGGNRGTNNSSPSMSISTKDSKSLNTTTTATNHHHQNHNNAPSVATPQSRTSTVRGACLTFPADPVGNGGLDNGEGNLIVHENDRIKVSRKNIRTIHENHHHTTTTTTTTAATGGRNGHNNGSSSSDANNNSEQQQWTTTSSAEFRIQGMLGQGTFAQVFRCYHVQSGQYVAMKIVKNKPAYTRQAAVEIEVFRALKESVRSPKRDCMVNLLCYFMHESHLCLVFELLGQNLYEILKRRQFRGLPLTIVQDIIRQALGGIRDLSATNIVHCDLKPENVLLVSDAAADELVQVGEGRRRAPPNALPTSPGKNGDATSTLSGSKEASTAGTSSTESVQNLRTVRSEEGSVEGTTSMTGRIKLIDFGSACFEGYTAHTYIQSRFYRSPEVLLGVPYDSVIDLWSLGCVAAELFLGLPILPGVHEHDQLGRISEMIAQIPDWMIDQGSKATKYFIKFVPRPLDQALHGGTDSITGSSPAPPLPQWRLKSQQEYISSLSQGEIRKKGGLSKLEKQPENRYFKRKRLADILFLHGQSMISSEKELVPAFVHFLYGLLEPDPWKRWTAFQVIQHPFITGDFGKLRPRRPDKELNPKEENQANLELGVYWEPPWDPSICRRKLLNVQKMREKQEVLRKAMSGRSPVQGGPAMETPGDRRRVRRNEQGVPSQTSEFDSVRISDGSSPPPNVNSTGSLSTNATTPSSRRSVDAFTLGSASFQAEGAYVGTSASSMANLSQPRLQGEVLIGDHGSAYQGVNGNFHTPVFSGAQSLSGIGDRAVAQVPHGGDFAHALQRPGVVPGRDFGPSSQCGSVASSQASLSISGGLGSYNNPQMYPSTGNPGSSLPFQNMGYPGYQTNMPPPAPLSSSSGPLGEGRYFSAPMPSTASVVSSLTMPDTMIDTEMQLALHIQQQQAALLQQQQLQQQHHHQQQQYQQQFGVRSGFSLQPQQQVYLATAADGSQYYVTTSASGQPIVLQPVAYLDQNSSNQASFGFPGGQFVGTGMPMTAGAAQQPPQAYHQQQSQFQQSQPHFNTPRRGSHHGHRQGQHQSRYDRGGTSM